jgi:hypothetical protein
MILARQHPSGPEHDRERGDSDDPLHAMEWVTMYALAVNEENASGGRPAVQVAALRSLRVASLPPCR